MSNAGRPKKKIDKEQFEKLCGILCTKREIADWFSVSDDTIERFCKQTYKTNFAVIYEQKASMGRVSLRRTQFQKAMSGNVALLIWLGKQYLGQKDKLETEMTGEGIKINIQKQDEGL